MKVKEVHFQIGKISLRYINHLKRNEKRKNKKKIWAMGNRCSDIGKQGRQEGREETNMML